MYDILLINPDTEINKKYASNSAPLAPPMGTFSIASYLDNKGFKVKLLDTRILDNTIETILKYAKESKFIGFSAMTAQIPHIEIISKTIRSKYPDKKIIWGGVHASLFPEQCIEHPLVDFIIKGEGEKALEFLLNNPDTTEKIIEREMLTVDEIPKMNYDLVDVEKYIPSHFYGKEHRKLEYSTSRGCPFRCAFCINVVFWKRNYRVLPAERVLDELEEMVNKYKLTAVWFRDEDMFANKERTIKILNGIIERKIKIIWRTNLRVSYFNSNYIDDEILDLIYKSGGRELYHGVESGSDRVRKFIKKDITERQVLRSASLYRKHKIVPVYSFMCGIPTETKDEFYETLNLIGKIKKRCPNAIILGPQPYRPYPGGELYDTAIQMGYIPPKSTEDWEKEFDLFTSSVKPEKFPWIDKKNISLFENAGKYITLGTRTFEEIWKLSKLMILPWMVSRLRWKYKYFHYPIDWHIYTILSKFIRFY